MHSWPAKPSLSSGSSLPAFTSVLQYGKALSAPNCIDLQQPGWR